MNIGKFLSRHKFKLLGGIGVIGTGSIVTSGVLLGGKFEDETERQMKDIPDYLFQESPENSVIPTLAAHSYLNGTLASSGSKITDKGYKFHHQGHHLSVSDLGWEPDKIKSYPEGTIARKLRTQNYRLISEHASDNTWKDMAMFILDQHADKEDSFLQNYSIPFRYMVLSIKHNWEKQDELQYSWGRDLKKLCTTSYRKEYDVVKEYDTMVSIVNLCSTPDYRTESVDKSVFE